MRDVSGAVRKFRAASLNVWNDYVMPGQGVFSPVAEESFYAIEKELLRCLVFHDEPAKADGYRKQGGEALLVRLVEDAPVHFGSPDGRGNIVWSSPQVFEGRSEDAFLFFDFFDWFHYGVIEYDLVRAVDRASGAWVLLPQSSCSFFISDAVG